MLAVGAVVRVLAMVAYPPALFFGDSWGYVISAFSGHALGFVPVTISSVRPSGYPLLVWLFSLPGRNLTVLVAVQHLTGLIAGALVYAALLRARARPAVAAAAAALVLLDGYAITVEQYVMPEAFFGLTLLVALTLLVWPRLGAEPRFHHAAPISPRTAAIVGVLLAAAILQRTVALFAIPVIAGYLVWRRVWWRRLVVFGAALVVPLLAYAAAYDGRYGSFSLTRSSGWILYGRVAGFADCKGAGISSSTRPLCETAAMRKAHPDAPTWYIFSPSSPAVRLFGGEVETAPARSNAGLGAFARRILLHQPLDYLGVVASDVVRFFTPGASAFGDRSSATSLPVRASDEYMIESVRRRFLSSAYPQVRSPASIVRSYRDVVHVPRPVLGLLVICSIAGIVLRRKARREVFLFSGTAAALLIGTAASAGFGMRYLLPVVPLLAVGGGLGVPGAHRRENEGASVSRIE